jgi:hypothetical protein
MYDYKMLNSKSGKFKTLLVVLLCLPALGCSSTKLDVEQEPFTIVVLPDTQHEVNFQRQKAQGFAIDSSELFMGQMRYLADQATANGGNVVFVSSVGDVWEHATDGWESGHASRGIVAEAGTTHRNINRDGVFDVEIPKVIEGYTVLSNADVPFGVAPGNHDYDAWWSVAGSEIRPNGRYPAHVGGLDNFRMVFGNDSKFFADKEWYVDSFRGGANSAQVFSAGGYQFLHLALEMQPGDEVLAWAEQVVAEHPGLPTIVATHDYLNPQGERIYRSSELASDDPEYHNSREDMWQQFIRRTDQIFMVLCGHQSGQALRVDENDYGHAVYQVLSDYQKRGQAGLDAGQAIGRGGSISSIGDGWLREMTFRLDADQPRVDVRTYSSHYDAYSSELATYAEWYKENEQPEMTDDEFAKADEFTIELSDFRSRFSP